MPLSRASALSDSTLSDADSHQRDSHVPSDGAELTHQTGLGASAYSAR